MTEKLYGLSAGKICYSSIDLDWSTKAILEGAETMWESGRSSWILVEERMDGGTTWRSPDKSTYASVDAEGAIDLETIN